jgi:hypothetical protein
VSGSDSEPQLKALVTPDIFEVIDWPGIFGVVARRCSRRFILLSETLLTPV